MFRNIRRGIIGSTIGIGFGLSQGITNYYSRCDNKEKTNDPRIESREMVAVYLTEKSKDFLEKVFSDRGMKNKSADYVCVNSHADPATLYVFHPLFGDRMAFRIKGMIHLPDGNAVAVGRISSMTGEIKDDHFEVSMPIFDRSTYDHNNYRALTDIPTRLRKFLDFHGGKAWKGEIPAGYVGHQKYDAIKISYTPYPIEKQLVVDGYMCSSETVDEAGRCTFEFDPSTIITEEEEKSIEAEMKADNSAGSKDENSAKSDGECPVCRYIKKGNCAGEWDNWNSCLKSLQENQELSECSIQTAKMMRCMQNNEYYDIMTAGTDWSKIDQLESTTKHT
jgi:uncharacterized protein (DUF1810 family)